MSLPAFMAPQSPARSLTTVLNFPGGGGTAKATPLAGFPLQSQALDNWCWAAVAAGVDAVRGARQSQCTIAGRYGGVTGDPQVAGKLQPPTCPPTIANDTIGYLNEVLDCLGLSRSTFASITDGATVETQARLDLKQKRPVPFRIAWSGSGGGHFLAIVGASNQGLLVYDPAESKASVNHLVMVTAAVLSKGGYDGAGKWSHVYPVN